jgi:hypothetical protein
MECGHAAALICVVAACVIAAEAKAFSASQPISPTLEPESSKKFFGKDYPADHRPKVDVLHFKHPYPIVQDSGDYDKDFIKDENADNGHWKAQQEYDRLRHKLLKEKKEAQDALEKRRKEEADLKRAMEQHKKNLEKAKLEDDKKKAATADVKKDLVDKDAQREKSAGWNWPGWNWGWPDWKWSWPSSTTAAPPTAAAGGTGISEATKEVEQEVKSLEECKKELEAAREKLKALTKELEEAEEKRSKADAIVDEAQNKASDLGKKADQFKDARDQEKVDYAKAREEYSKQQALVEEMKKDLAIAAARVKKYRDAEDSTGGVYNTEPARRSGTFSAVPLGGLVIALIAGSQIMLPMRS